MSESKIGFTLQQIQDVRRLADRLLDMVGNNIADNDVWFAHQVAIYFSRLALDAATEKLPVRNVEDEISTRVVPEVRRATLTILQDSLGRKLAAEDLLNRLKEAGPVDDAVAAALRRDLADLKS